MTTSTPITRGARRIFWPALVVALGAAAATAHGLYEVAVASRVPSGIAWLYPVITDGLALVAYAATRQLGGATARRYAWFVVVVAAGLSGLAQAVLLASDDLTAPTEVRFGIGAWPAVAAAVVAHLLYLLAADSREQPTVQAESDEPAETGEWEPRDWWADAPVAQELIPVARSLAAVPESPAKHPERKSTSGTKPTDEDMERAIAFAVDTGAAWKRVRTEFGFTEHYARKAADAAKQVRQEASA